LTVDESVLQHEITLNGLSPATVYHVKVGSGDITGTNYFSDHIVITSSGPASTGEMNVYFNKSIEPSLACADNQTNGNQNLEQKFIQRINAAQYSIDFCFYSWNLPAVTDAVLNAYHRNVKIRFIYDCEHNQYHCNRLKQTGITVIDNAFGNNDGAESQHNKFAIFDARDNTSAIDDWVWTGSLNLTDADEYGVNAAQNVIEIQDQALAKAYTIEFNEMWGSDGDVPDFNQSRFGPRKLDNTPHKFVINNSPVELYFCPSDQATSKIVNAINFADFEIYFCIFAFTRIDVEQAMYEKFFNLNGFAIRGVFDSSQLTDPSSQYLPMHGQGEYAWNSPSDVWLDQESGLLHHKYMIIDAHHLNSDPIVITGCQNWSGAAETRNDENTLIIHNALIANQYLQEFANRYHAAGGADDLTNVEDKILAETPHSFMLYQNYPNPFNSATMISYEIKGNSDQQVELAMFNLLGQRIKTLVSQNESAGFYKVQWDGRNESGEMVSSGIYVYQLKVANVMMDKKLIFLQ
jgi:phosphatidylserine/phosphatidylglycerophosphate/cardiolipin synthase-like enzyme